MRKLFRSRTDSKLTGLCGGFAQYFCIDATIIRLALVISALFTGGTTLLIYFLAAIIVPKEPGFSGFYDEHMYRHH